MGLQFTMPSHDWTEELFQVDIRRILNPNLGRLQKTLFEEMRKNVDAELSVEGDLWHKVDLSKAMHNIIFRTLNCIIVGQCLCHEEGYLKSFSTFMNLWGGSGLVVGQMLPPILKPVAGYLAALPIHYYKRKSLSYLIPVVKAEMREFQGGRTINTEESTNFLRLMVAAAMEGNDARHLTPDTLAANILFLVSTNFKPVSGLTMFDVSNPISSFMKWPSRM